MVPRAREGFAGESEIETSAAGSTVKIVEPVTAPDVADIVVLPVATLVARPVLSIVATLLSEEAQETLASCCELPSLKIPVATNVWVVPFATDGWSGVRTIELKVGAVTVRVAEPATVPWVAVMLTVPGIELVARPVFAIEATELSDEAHVT